MTPEATIWRSWRALLLPHFTESDCRVLTETAVRYQFVCAYFGRNQFNARSAI
jgi:hypothetical protein